MNLTKAFFAASLLMTSALVHALPPTGQWGAERALAGPANPKEVVFIHGMFVTPKCWDGWMAYFKERGYVVSAPAWPEHEGSVNEVRSADHQAALGKVELSAVIDQYRQLLSAKTVKPVLVGHSMGGLVAQILLSEGLAQAAVAIDSAPPKGVLVPSWSFIKANWGALNPLADKDQPISFDLKEFSYVMTNAQPEATRGKIYEDFYVPESRRVGKGPTTKAAAIDRTKPRGPLLLIAGGEDHIIPAKLNYANFKAYKNTPGYTEFLLFEGRDHWTIGGLEWKKVAAAAHEWIEARFHSATP